MKNVAAAATPKRGRKRKDGLEAEVELTAKVARMSEAIKPKALEAWMSEAQEPRAPEARMYEARAEDDAFQLGSVS